MSNNNNSTLVLTKQDESFIDGALKMNSEIAGDKSLAVLSDPKVKLAIVSAAKSPIMAGVADNMRIAEAVTRVVLGAGVGLPPMIALQQIANVNGRYCIWGDALQAIVRKSGLCKYIQVWTEGEDDNLVGFARTVREGEGDVVHEQSFSIKEAKQAKLTAPKGKFTNTPWILYPKRMVVNRARTYLLRNVYADILMGMSSAEELQEASFVKNADSTVTKSQKINDLIEGTEAEVSEVVNNLTQEEANSLGKKLLTVLESESDLAVRQQVFKNGDGNITGQDIIDNCSDDISDSLLGLITGVEVEKE